MSTKENKTLHMSVSNCLLKLHHRAEAVERKKLIETFVDVGPLLHVLSTTNHQIIYGRRGTGKTHALLYLADKVKNDGNISIYIDLRTIGSTGGIYADPSISLTERGTRLLADTLSDLHSALLEVALSDDEKYNLGVLGPLMDRFADAITEVQVRGEIENERTHSTHFATNESANIGLTAGISNLSVEFGSSGKLSEDNNYEERSVVKGSATHRVHFGSVYQSLSEIVKVLNNNRIWLILDEWSTVPIDLQPLLADLIRRSIFPVSGITVKIGAIEQRSSFQIVGDKGDYIGIELGADASADLNLDDFMVFDNDENKATDFFENLLFRHYKAIAEEPHQHNKFNKPNELTKFVFSRKDVFREFVRATEGVPRDAINIVGLAARTAYESAISMEHIRKASKSWYQRDKEQSVSANPRAKNVLIKIIDEVIGHRQARAFLFRSDQKHKIIDELFDKRVLHILKRNISAHDQPGVRYDVFKIDYGCYVDLLTTNKSPQGLLPFESEDEETKYIDVPPDDYRAIRRAILKIEDIEA